MNSSIRPAPLTFLLLAALAASQVGAAPDTQKTARPAPRPAPQPAPTAGASVGQAIISTPEHSPDHLDFGEVWDGQASAKTFSFAVGAAGYVRAEIAPGPFFVSEIQEVSPPTMGSKNNPNQSQVSVTWQTKGRVTFTEVQPGPWTYGAVGVGDQVRIKVVFKPKFDFGTMMAGPKSATMKVSGPGPMGNWALQVPLNGMFNGKHTSPLLILPQKEFLEVANPFESVKKFVIRLVGAGEDVTGSIVWPSASPGLKVKPYGNVHVGGSETKEITVPVEGTGGHNESTPLDGTVAFQFVRQGQSIPQQTLPVSFRVTFVPSYFGRDLPDKTCNGVSLSRPTVTAYANGNLNFHLTLGPQASQSRFEVFFPQAGRTLLHTTAPADLNQQIVVRVEENGPVGLATASQGFYVNFDGKFNPGTPDSLNRYLALMRSSAEIRCW